jgi:hypothetical protein
MIPVITFKLALSIPFYRSNLVAVFISRYKGLIIVTFIVVVLFDVCAGFMMLNYYKIAINLRSFRSCKPLVTSTATDFIKFSDCRQDTANPHI